MPTIFDILNVIIMVLLIGIACYLAFEVYRLKASILISAKHWLLLYGYVYILLPSLLIETTSRLQSWRFTENTILLTKLASIYFILILLAIAVLYKKDRILGQTERLPSKRIVSKGIAYLWWAVLAYSIFSTGMVAWFFINADDMSRVASAKALESLVTTYKLNSVAFLSLTIGTIKYWEDNRLHSFLPLLIICSTDVIAGGRTLAFIALIAIYLNMAIKHRKLFARNIAFLMLVLLISVTASRAGNQITDPHMSALENFAYQSCGEFVQPMNTFAYAIEHEFKAQKPAEELLANLTQGFLPGIVKKELQLLENSPGQNLASIIHRGYGLGFNIMTEAYYYGGWMLLAAYPFLLGLLVLPVNTLLIRLRFPGFVCMLYFLIYLRLFFREGMASYLFIPFYLFVVYGFLSWFWYRTDVIRVSSRKTGLKERLADVRVSLKTEIKNNKRYMDYYNALFARPIKNINHRKFDKKALLSYSVYPFLRKNRRMIHPNFVESYALNRILDELGYVVDVYNNTYKRKIDYTNYDLILGEGLPISNYFTSGQEKKARTIYYATGSHPIFQNTQSFKRLVEFYHKSGKWIPESSRIVDDKWFVGSSLADYHIIIGNEVTKNSFLPYASESDLHTINPPFYKAVHELDLSKKNKRKFLWFGSYGLLHKGLDVVLDTFLERADLELHICGYTQGEAALMEHYTERVRHAGNISDHGFISIEGELFRELMESCSFVILTSAAEGLATAVITAMGNGGLIPIVTKETGVDVGLGIPVNGCDSKSLAQALEESQQMGEDEIRTRTVSNRAYIQENFSESRYEEELRVILYSIHHQGETE